MIARFGPVIDGVHADTIRLIRNQIHLIDADFRRDPVCNQLFMDFLREPYGISHGLWKMHLYGVLGAFFPDFQRVTGQMQHDLFHIYTVDEHTLKTVGNARLNSRAEWVEDMPQCHDIYQELAKPELLVLGALLHDIGKGLGGNHSKLGAAIARGFCHRLQLTSIDSQLVVWLVETHLDMSSLSQNADIDDPQVIRRFASHVGSLAKLDFLYLLTIADMRATGPTVWNGWKGSLLQQLYRATRLLFETDLDAPAHPSGIDQTKQLALRLMALERVTAEQANTFWNRLDVSYFSRFSAEEMAWHAKHVIPSLADSKLPVVATRNFPERGGTGLFVYSADRPNLFAAIASSLDREGLTIVDARILTTANGFALDTFILLDKEGELLQNLDQRRVIRHAVRHALEPEKLAPKPNQRRQGRQSKAFLFTSTINFNPGPQPYARLMEVTCSDRPGLLSTIAMILSEHQVAILDARINTYGERVQDQFTILLPEDDLPQIDKLLEQLEISLSAALDPKDKQAASLQNKSNHR
ncbi:MAG: HD domain-containing protein [Immundisolibacteraceae bacterium]|nr:HD domain-containing protein [Immundisolibacteraceae bacterium]